MRKEKETKTEVDSRVKKKIMTWREFMITYSVLLLLVGIQMGILVLPAFDKLIEFAQVAVIMLYWIMVALSFSFITNRQIKKRYDKPMRLLSQSAKEIASGDFSVYVPPMHTSDKYDYIDVMFLDFNKMVQELGSIETLKNDFVANVSHEIKTPLAIIRNYTTMIKNPNISDEVRNEYIETIIQATDNLSALVSNILRLNKLDNQEIKTESEQFDLCRQLCDCALQFESIWEEKDIEFVMEIDDCAMIVADKSMLEIVWNNLLSNAFKYTKPGGKVFLSQTFDTDEIVVNVTDTGCGMSYETTRHIFDKFYQADTSHTGNGNGLGLALASRVMEKLGGTITVTSELGKGSTFTARLPVDY